MCSIWECDGPSEFRMVSWNGWPLKPCAYHAAVWDRKGIAKLDPRWH